MSHHLGTHLLVGLTDTTILPCGKRPHHPLGIPPPAATAAATVFAGDAIAPTETGKCKGHVIFEPDKVIFVVFVLVTVIAIVVIAEG